VQVHIATLANCNRQRAAAGIGESNVCCILSIQVHSNDQGSSVGFQIAESHQSSVPESQRA
jgi:hypothetical protein